eukprot:scaffold253284_cov35-Tisochrysis_lutea.AAC.1
MREQPHCRVHERAAVEWQVVDLSDEVEAVADVLALQVRGQVGAQALKIAHTTGATVRHDDCECVRPVDCFLTAPALRSTLRRAQALWAWRLEPHAPTQPVRLVP